MVQQLQLSLGKSEKLYINLGEIKNICINRKDLGKVRHPNQIWQFLTASFNCG